MKPIRLMRSRKIATGGGGAGSGWDPSLKGTNISLSNGNLDATKSGSGYQSVYGTNGRSSGRYAFEFVVTAIPSVSALLVGIADKTNSALMITSYIGNSSGPVEAFGLNDNDTGGSSRRYQKMTAASMSGASSSPAYSTVGAVVTVDVNMTTNTVAFYINGVGITAAAVTIGPMAITSGKTYYPAASIQNGAAISLRTSGLSYLPSGSTEWG